MVDDTRGTESMTRESIQHPIICARIESPHTSIAQIGQARRKPLAQQAKQSKNHVRIGSSIGHDLRWLEISLLLKQDTEQDQAIP